MKTQIPKGRNMKKFGIGPRFISTFVPPLVHMMEPNIINLACVWVWVHGVHPQNLPTVILHIYTTIQVYYAVYE